MVAALFLFCVDFSHYFFLDKVEFFLDFGQGIFPQLSDSFSDGNFFDFDGLSESTLT